MKDVSEGKINDEFVGLKSKMYSIKAIDGKETNTAKCRDWILKIQKRFVQQKNNETQNEKNSSQQA